MLNKICAYEGRCQCIGNFFYTFYHVIAAYLVLLHGF